MSELNLFGFDHSKRGYNLAYRALQETSPDIITLEMKLFDYDGEVYLSSLFDGDLRYLDWVDKYLRKNRRGGEFQEACVFARRNDLPLYFIDKTSIPPGKVIKYDLMKVKNPHHLFKFRLSSDEFFRGNNLFSRNVFMARTLDLLVCPKINIGHIGGSWHIEKDNPEKATPIQDLVKNFDMITPTVLS